MDEVKLKRLLKKYGVNVDDFMRDLNAEEFDPDQEDDLELDLKKDAKDEQEAIEGYDKTLNKVTNETMRDQITQIKNEEVAHKKYLEEAQKNPNAKYHDPR